MLNVRYEQPNCVNATIMQEAFDAQGMLCHHKLLLLYRCSHKTPSWVYLFPLPRQIGAQIMLNVGPEQPDCDHDDARMQEAFGAAGTGICFATTTTPPSLQA